jgi:hypothetical protein
LQTLWSWSLRRRRYYRLTSEGQKVLASQRRGWLAFVEPRPASRPFVGEKMQGFELVDGFYGVPTFLIEAGGFLRTGSKIANPPE